MAGYRVVEAANLDEAIRGLEQQPVDVVVAGAGSCRPAAGPLCWPPCAARPEWERIPVLALADSAEPSSQASAVRTAGFQDCQVKFDRDAMLESVARLASALASQTSRADVAPERRR